MVTFSQGLRLFLTNTLTT